MRSHVQLNSMQIDSNFKSCWVLVGLSHISSVLKMSCIHMYGNQKWDLLKLFQEWGWWRRMVEEWIQVWYIWYIVRTFVNATMYPHPSHTKKKKSLCLYVLLSIFCLPEKSLEDRYTIYLNKFILPNPKHTVIIRY
jgi:hypothetical protein